MKTIGQLLKGRTVFSVSPQDSVLDASKAMAEKNVGAMAVLDGSRLVGIVSERDVLRRVIVRERSLTQTTVNEIMTHDLVLVDVNDGYDSAIRKMHDAKIRHLLVVSEEKFVGVVSLRDMLEVDVDEKVHELKMMNEYIYYIPPYAH